MSFQKPSHVAAFVAVTDSGQPITDLQAAGYAH